MSRLSGRIVWYAFWMLLFGVGGMGIGWSRVADWEFLGAGTQVTYALFLCAGLALLLAAGWVIYTKGLAKTAWWIGTVAGVVFGVSLLIGVMIGTVPCSGPG